MKLSRTKITRRAFTIVEVMIATGLMMIVGGMAYAVLNSGMNLYAKNTAVNAAHQQARSGVDQMLQNIHGSVSIPQLVNTNLVPIAAPGVGPAAGLTFQRFEAGPFPVIANALATSTSIDLASGNGGAYTPTTNSRLNITSHNIELNVLTSTNLGGGTRRFNLSGPIDTDVTILATGEDGDPDTTYIISAFMTSRCSYAVIGTELRYYPTNNLATFRVVARNITSPTPFTIPTLTGGGLQNRYVAAVNISTVEPQFTQRGYAAVNMFISSLIPFRCRLTTKQ
jgi:type II secretory pathway pseudopilin PulG